MPTQAGDANPVRFRPPNPFDLTGRQGAVPRIRRRCCLRNPTDAMIRRMAPGPRVGENAPDVRRGVAGGDRARGHDPLQAAPSRHRCLDLTQDTA